MRSSEATVRISLIVSLRPFVQRNRFRRLDAFNERIRGYGAAKTVSRACGSRVIESLLDRASNAAACGWPARAESQVKDVRSCCDRVLGFQ